MLLLLLIGASAQAAPAGHSGRNVVRMPPREPLDEPRILEEDDELVVIMAAYAIAQEDWN
jgi:hypothetical protein